MNICREGFCVCGEGCDEPEPTVGYIYDPETGKVTEVPL